MTKDEITTLDYFARKAEEYDLVEQQVYWRLSDHLLWEAFNYLVLSKLLPNFRFLDAGGGTGRWSKKVLDNYIFSEGTLFDLCPEMLKQAELKRQQGLSSRLILQQGNLQDMGGIENNSFDVTFNFHNVLGFVESPLQALKEMVRVTKIEGYVVSFVPNLYHNIFFNVLLERLDEAEYSQKNLKGRFTNDMPYLHLFTPQSINQLYSEVNLKKIYIIGFPITIYPGIQETKITGSTQNIIDILGNPETFERVCQLEKSLMYEPVAASRGNNLFVVGVKGK